MAADCAGLTSPWGASVFGRDGGAQELFSNWLDEAVRNVHAEAVRVLNSAPPGARAEFTFTTDDHAGRTVELCTWTFQRTGEACHG